MTSGSPHVIQAALGTAWALQPQKLAAVAQVLARWASGEKLSAAEIQARIGDGKGAPQQGAGVAVLPLYGIIGHRMNQVQDISGPGGTSTEQFGHWFDSALNDPAIGAIVIDVDSPGGSVAGVPELAAKIYSARGQKPIIAIANSLAASAAYWIATAAEEFWCTPSGDVGSIGVYTMHQDMSAAYAEAGVTNTLISAGKFKTEGNPYEPLDEEARAALQERVDEYYTEFTKAVALYRGVTAADVRNGFGEGRVVSAVRAKRLGMVDKVGSLDTLLGKLGAGGSRSRLKAADLAPSLQLTAGALDRLEQYEAAERLGEARDIAAREWGEPVSAIIERVHNLLADITDAAPAAALPSQERADVAAEPVVIPTHGADEAKEFAMSDKGTPAAEAAAQAALAAAEKENERIAALSALAADEGVSISVLNSWISGKASVETAMKGLLAEKKAALAGAPAIRHSVSALEGGDNGTKHGPYNKHEFGAMLQDVAAASAGRGVSHRLAAMQAAVTSGGASAALGSDGAFAIQKDFSVDLLESAFKAGEILSRCDTTEISANADGLEVVYLDESSRATGSRWGGVQVYHAAEADSATMKKPQLGKWESRVEDIIGAMTVTERLLADAPALADVASKGFAEEFAFTAENDIWRGTGAGQAIGIIGAPGTVSVAKETGQTADTIVAENIMKMWRSVHPRSRKTGAWFINVECESELDKMMIGTGASGQLVYMAPGGLSGAAYGTIKGRPVIPVEYASGLGDVGDIVFADFSRYKVITKGGLQSDESIHVRFLNNERTFRWITRFNGAPKDKTALTPFKATDTNLKLSAFVTLAAR